MTPQLPVEVEGCIEGCRRCEAVIEAVPPALLRTPWRGHSPIGAHLRHCIEHLEALLDACDSGVADYDARARNPELERSPAAMRAAFDAAASRLRALGAPMTRPIAVRQYAAPGVLTETASTLGRELIFCTGHTLHHLALIEVFAQGLGIALPQGIGLAYSTAAHLGAARARA